MARPPLPLGTWGKITRAKTADGRWRARASYRDYDGRTRVVERFGKTGAAAERTLTEALRDRAKPTDTVVDISRDTTIEDLGRLWIAKRQDDRLAAHTVRGYQRMIDKHITPAIGGIRVGEATVGRLDSFIRAIASDSAGKQCRVVLSGMMQLAAQHDAIDHNPVDSVTKRRSDRAPARALTLDEFTQLRTRVREWSGANASGPKRGVDLPDLFDLMAGTGIRIGEALAVRREDFTSATEVVGIGGETVRVPATITIAGTVLDDGTRQPFPKTHLSHRAVSLPRFAEAAVRRQIARDLPTDEGLLWPSRTGGPRTTNNTRRQLRAARQHVEHETADPAEPRKFEWVTPHSLRRTAATMIESEMDIETASKVLGHSSPDVTRAHYIDRAAATPDASAVLDVLVSGGFSVGGQEKAPSRDSRKGA